MKQLLFVAKVYDMETKWSIKTIGIEVSDETAAMLQKDIEAAEKRKGHSPYDVNGEGEVNIEAAVICGNTLPDGSIDTDNAFGCCGL